MHFRKVYWSEEMLRKVKNVFEEEGMAKSKIGESDGLGEEA